jgi:hypothetical protein
MSHKSAKSKRLSYLLELSYDMSAVGTDDDAVFLERAIEREKDPELREALQDLDDFLFGR